MNMKQFRRTMITIPKADAVVKLLWKATCAQQSKEHLIARWRPRRASLLLVAVALLTITNPVHGSQQDLSFVDITHSLGDGFGEVKDVFVDNNTVYLAGQCVMRSRDGGGSWERLSIGGNFANIGVKRICAKANLICAVTYRGLAISSDSGNSWIDGGLGDDNIDSVCIDGDSIYAGSSRGLLRSRDSGQSWRVVGSRLRRVSVDSASHLMCAVSDNTRYGGLHVSKDGGNTWTEIKDTAPTFEIVDVAVSGGVIFVATSRKGLFSSADAGKTWVSHSMEGSNGWPVISTVFAEGGMIFVGTGSGGLGGGLKVSADGGTTWRTYDLRDGCSWTIRRVAASGPLVFVTSSESLYVSTGVPRKWAAVRMNLDAGIAFAPGAVMYANTRDGILKSSDQGKSWNLAYSIDVFGDGGLVSDIDAEGLRVYLASSHGVAFSEDGGRLWHYRSTAHGLGSNSVSSVVVRGNTVLATTGGGLSISYDGGHAWTNHPLQCGVTSGSNARVVTNDKKVITSLGGGCLHVSADEGRTWIKRAVTCGGERDQPDLIDFCVRGRSIIACVRCGGMRMRVSNDDGISWNDFGIGTLRDVVHVNCIANLANTIYLGTNSGLFVSADDGQTWTKEEAVSGLPSGLPIIGLKVFAGRVYATTNGGITFASSSK